MPSYYSEYEGFLISAAIDKYVYITVHRPFSKTINLKYSEMEKVKSVDEIRHPIFREVLKMVNMDHDPRIEIVSFADVPSGTGLGSSGSFTTALLKALHGYKRNLVHPRELAEQACDIEINRLGEQIGKQDQYISAYGGVTCFEFKKNGWVNAYPLEITKETLYDLEDNLLLFFTGYSRSASSILAEQNHKSKDNDKEMIENLHFVKDLGLQSKKALEAGDLRKFGELLDVHWENKKNRSGAMSNGRIDDWYSLALKNGAIGGKLVGAGGGGFLMFYSEDTAKLRHAMMKEGLEEMRFRFCFEGAKVVTES